MEIRRGRSEEELSIFSMTRAKAISGAHGLPAHSYDDPTLLYNQGWANGKWVLLLVRYDTRSMRTKRIRIHRAMRTKVLKSGGEYIKF